MNSFFNKFKENYKKQGFPFITTSIIIGFTLFKQNKLSIFRKNEIPQLPPKDSNKPTILLDYNVIIKNKIPFLFPFKRKYTDEFLFHLCQMYELISVTNIPHISSKEVDPYGCISYHYFLPDKYLLNKSHLLRDNLICICRDRNAFHPELMDNVLEIKNEYSDDKLFTLLDFFTNLYFTDRNNWLNTIKSYKNKDFFVEFTSLFKRLFYKKNTFNFFNSFEKERKKINDERIWQYNQSKVIMDENIKKYEYLEKKESVVSNLLKKAISFIL